MKKIINHILTDILIFSVIVLTVIVLGRNILSNDNIYNLVKDSISEKGSTNNIEEGILKDFINEEDSEEIIKYINENEFDEEMGNIISSYFRYTSGISDKKPDTSRFEEIIQESINKYEKETGKKVDRKRINKALDAMDKVLEETTPSKIDKRIKIFFNMIYSDTLLIITINIVLILLALIYIVNRSVISVVKSSAIATSINTIFLFVLSFVISSINTETSINAINYSIKLSRNLGICFLILSVILISIIIINNKTNKKNKYSKKELIEEKIEE